MKKAYSKLLLIFAIISALIGAIYISIAYHAISIGILLVCAAMMLIFICLLKKKH